MDPDPSHLQLKFAIIQSRHPELVSGSIVPQTMRPNGEEWMLKQVQHDGHDTTNFSSTIQGSFPADAKGGIHAEARRSRRRSRDRKSVVSGKSVSVRVYLGGSRIIKKKNKHKKTEQQYRQ